MFQAGGALLLLTVLCSGAAFAAHPLITDDTGTQGKGKGQFEFIAEYGIDKEKGVTEKGIEVPTVPFLSYGLTDSMDLIFGLTYNSVKIEELGTASTVRGTSDASVEVKARFYDKHGLSFAVKPGVSLPTGNEEKGLGNGKVSYSTFLITTKEAKPWAFHLNLAYIRNEFRLQTDKNSSRKDLWHVSLASQVEVSKDLSLVANIGMERNPKKTSETHPAFILCGLVYSVAENLDLDFGAKVGLNKDETDTMMLAGITWRLQENNR